MCSIKTYNMSHNKHVLIQKTLYKTYNPKTLWDKIKAITTSIPTNQEHQRGQHTHTNQMLSKKLRS